MMCIGALGARLALIVPSTWLGLGNRKGTFGDTVLHHPFSLKMMRREWPTPLSQLQWSLKRLPGPGLRWASAVCSELTGRDVDSHWYL